MYYMILFITHICLFFFGQEGDKVSYLLTSYKLAIKVIIIIT